MIKTEGPVAEIIYNDKKYYMESTNNEEYFYSGCWTENKFYEIGLLEAIKEKNLKGEYIDLGSHLGNHSVFFATQCPCTKLYCVDACSYLFPYLKRNLERNNVAIPYETYNYAIREKGGYVRFEQLDINSLHRSRVLSEGGVSTPAISIDELFGDLTNVAVLKMDIEESEYFAMLGAEKFLKNNNPLITAELKYTKDFLRFREFMKSHYGYKTDEMKYAGTPTFIFERR